MEEFISFFNNEDVQNFIFHPQLIAFFLTIILEILRRIFTPKAYVIWGHRHGFNYLIPQNPDAETGNKVPDLAINTRSIFVKNQGRGAAKNVEFYFNYKPEHHEIWPVIQHKAEYAPDGRYIISFPYIKPKEYVSLEVIHAISEAPGIINVRAEEGKCKNVNMGPMQIFPSWVNFIIISILLLGIFQLLSILVSVVFAFLK